MSHTERNYQRPKKARHCSVYDLSVDKIKNKESFPIEKDSTIKYKKVTAYSKISKNT